MKAILSNMGFVLQMTGGLTIDPIITSFAFKETSAIIALLITATAFFALGFVLNALCERKTLSFRQSCSLIVLVFVFLSIIGAIPYFYVNAFNGSLYSRITDSIFESASGFTTTGFSMITDVAALPKSIIFYRSLTQFIGGIGIVLILLAFFYPEDKLREFSRSMGLGGNHKIKRTFIIILLIYLSYSVIMGGIAFFFGYKDIVTLASFIFSALSSGGFSPVNDIAASATAFPLNFILIISMLFGASNFVVVAEIFRLKFKEFIKSEIPIFIIIITIAVAVVNLVFNLSFFDLLFNVVSATTTTGFSYLPLGEFSNQLKLFLIVLMFIGGASFSTAGGIKIYRLILLFKSIKKAVIDSITEKNSVVRLFGREYSNGEIIHSLILIILMAAVILGSATAVSSYGFSFVDSLFETTSAVATTGLSVGIISPSLADGLKWLFISLMILGRVEIMAFLVMIAREPKITKEPNKE